jgi:hypothetical protein
MAQATSATIRLGLRANWQQLTLLVIHCNPSFSDDKAHLS